MIGMEQFPSMARGAPTSAVLMPNLLGISVLTLQTQITEGNSDYPVLAVRVDGQDPFARADSGWSGFDPDDLLGASEPLVPQVSGRRVAVACCGCGVAGCGALAPLIVASPNGQRISWVDFRSYTGVFDGPLASGATDAKGIQTSFPDLHFERRQYLRELERARQDRSWETPRRQVARLVSEQLRPLNAVLPPDLAFEWAAPAWDGDAGVVLSFERSVKEPERGQIHQRILKVVSELPEPVQAAEAITRKLLSLSPHDWVKTFEFRARRSEGRRARS